MSARFARSVALAAIVAAACTACGGGNRAESTGPVAPGLYSYDTSSHALRQLVPGKSERWDVSWSADGNWIASTDTGDFLVDVVRSTGGGLRDLDSVSWSPDGKTVAYSKGERLYVAKADWAGPRLVSSAPRSDALDWSPDGRSLMFGTGRLSTCCWKAIGVAHADGTGAHVLWAPPSDGEYDSWINSARSSPSGHQVAVDASLNNAGDSLYVLDLSGRGVKRLTGVDLPTPIEWSHSGNGLAFARSSDFVQGQGGELRACGVQGCSKIYTVRATGGQPRSLCPGPCHGAVFSNDGGRVAYVTGPEPKQTLWVENVDGTGRQRVAGDLRTALGWSPIRTAGLVWSPDGRKLGLMLFVPGKRYSVAVVDLGTSKITRITDGSHLDRIAGLSSDGSMVAFYRVGPRRRLGLWVASASGGDPTMVMKLSANPVIGPCPHVAWSPKAPVLAIANEGCAPS